MVVRRYIPASSSGCHPPMEIGNPSIELGIQTGSSIQPIYCGLFCPAVVWLVPGRVKKKKQRSNLEREMAQCAVRQCFVQMFTTKNTRELCASFMQAAPDVPKGDLQICGTAVDLIECTLSQLKVELIIIAHMKELFVKFPRIYANSLILFYCQSRSISQA